MQLWQKHIISTGFADKPLDSEWHSMSIDKLSIDRFEMKPWRASSYIPTPEKYSNSTYGRMHIKNTDQEC